jgi:hypothetical protein
MTLMVGAATGAGDEKGDEKCWLVAVLNTCVPPLLHAIQTGCLDEDALDTLEVFSVGSDYEYYCRFSTVTFYCCYALAAAVVAVQVWLFFDLLSAAKRLL